MHTHDFFYIAHTLWELYSVEVFILQREFTAKNVSKDEFKKGLSKLIGYLQVKQHQFD